MAVCRGGSVEGSVGRGGRKGRESPAGVLGWRPNDENHAELLALETGVTVAFVFQVATTAIQALVNSIRPVSDTVTRNTEVPVGK